MANKLQVVLEALEGSNTFAIPLRRIRDNGSAITRSVLSNKYNYICNRLFFT